MNIGLLIVRLAVGLLLAGHGTQKAFGWFGGVGFSATSEFLESVGYRPGKVAGLLAVVGELGGGLLLALGLLTPFPAAMVVGVMLNASHVHWPRFWNSAGGFEYPLVLAAVGAGIGFTGPGRISLDQAIGWSLRGNGWGAAAVAVGAGAALLTLVAKHAGPRAMSHEQASSQRDGDDQRAA